MFVAEVSDDEQYMFSGKRVAKIHHHHYRHHHHRAGSIEAVIFMLQRARRARASGRAGLYPVAFMLLPCTTRPQKKKINGTHLQPASARKLSRLLYLMISDDDDVLRQGYGRQQK